MSQSISVNGVTISYPETGDVDWGSEGTNFAIQVAAALGKLGLGSGTTASVVGTLTVAGNTTLSANLTVSNDSAITGNLTVNGNTTLGNANTDTITVTGIVNVDSGTLYVDPVNNRVGINDTTPSEALDVNGNVAITGNETIGGTLGVTGNTTLSASLLNSNGSAASPSISFSGDTDTGLYNISANKFGFTANGSRVGEFGIGYGGFVGNVIQVAYNELLTSGVTSSTSIPFDNTIPQNTEGAEILTCSITPKYSNSILYVESIAFLGENSNVADGIIAALFRDSTVDAISTSFYIATPSGVIAGISFSPIMTNCKVNASSTSSTTFKLRAGLTSSGVLRYNGANGSQYFNGSLVSYIKIYEVQV